ncbi:hypothetical protein PFICI_11992 [Pestalotiopsis fici W106-1]|uniref:Protein kinase domain-containing protein n=1 Tax=Pestalotiopsis fici (strain W106-1 / CGMCC3.15140) TaxID=1229662 RepID=W3WRW7_PESFW|nr:uncharacterized protein PFICI_11992 [Pestalotiopsis fici W106-1]ETS76605.1 hypothetical protein PFICI_11992 [Pestalotiopsis fici W106-1]
MPPRMSYGAGAHHLMDEFVKALEMHANAENCRGRNGLDETVMFIPNDFLFTYWTEDIIRDLLLSLSGAATYDTSIILSEYIIVFSILTKMYKSDWISHFVEKQIKDSSLPLRPDSNMPKSWTDQRHMEDLWKDFINEQWMFCPYTFDRLSNAELSESYILPIQSKECLQDKAVDGDLAILYKVKLHPSCRGSLSEYVVFKEYQREDPIAAATYEKEISIYKTLKPGSSAFKHIIEYYGSFQILASGKRTIMLEYADGSDLSAWFKELKPPSEVEHLTAFWANFFDLLLGLEAIHNLVPPHSGRESWYLEGIHQDIRPHNILLVKKPSSSHPYDVTFKLVDFGTGYIKKQSLDQFRETHRDNFGNATYSSPESLNDRLQPESDVWALGALASETLVWSIQGWKGVENYCNLRAAKMVQGLPETHRGCFHNGIHRLPIIDDHHREVLKGRLAEDNISPLVSKMILEHMLVEHPSALEGRASPNPQFRRRARETHRLWKMKLQMIPLARPYSTDDVRGRLHHTVTEPVLATIVTADDFLQQSEFDPDESSAMSRYSSVTYRRPEGPINSFHESYDAHSVRRGPSQHYRPRNPILQNEDSFERLPMHLLSPKPDRSSLIRDLMNQMVQTAEGTNTQQDPPRFDNDTITINTIYDKFIARKDGKGRVGAAFSKFTGSSSDQKDPLKVHPDLGLAISKLKNSGSSGREQVFLIDDSKSMSRFQTSIAKTVRVLAYLIKKGDVDPDRSIELRFASQIGDKKQNAKSTPLEDAINDWPFEDSVCEMGTALEALLLDLLPKRYAADPKPVSVYVLTNALWSDKTPTSLCGVDEAIEKALRHLDNVNVELGKKWLGIQFIGFFNNKPSSENTIGRRRLEFLDDKLGELFEALDLKFTRKDIVDTRESDDDIRDILLGAVSDVWDKKKG